MLFELDDTLEVKDLEIFVAHPDRTLIGKLNEAYNRTLDVELGEISELNFTIPYKIEKNHKIVDNPNIDKTKNRYLLKVIYDGKVEWFRISETGKESSDNVETKAINAFSLGIELGDKMIRNVEETSKNIEDITEIGLSKTPWTIDEIDNEIKGLYRSFDIDESSVLDFVFEIAETFKAVIVWNTIDKKISFKAQDNVGSNQGLKISYGRYMKSFSKESDSNEMATRLIPRGHEGQTIRSISPTGMDYIDDFSYFLYPFQRDKNKKVVEHSYYMSDALCHSILNHNELVESRDGEISDLFEERNTLNKDLLDELKILSDLEMELNQAENSLDIEEANDRKEEAKKYREEKEKIEVKIEEQEEVVDDCETQLEENQEAMKDIQEDLSVDKNFAKSEIEELENNFVIQKTWSDDNITDPEDLLEEAKKAFKEIKEPKIEITIDIVSFIQILEGQRDWGKLNAGDTIYLYHEQLQEQLTAKIIKFDVDFDGKSVNLTIANTKDIKNSEDKFIESLYETGKIATSIDMNKYKWNETVKSTSEIGEIIDGKWDAVKRRIVAGADESVEIDRRGLTITNPEYPNEVLVAQAGVLAVSNDGKETWRNAITGSGIVGQEIFGKLLAGEQLMIDASNTNGESTFTVDGDGVKIKGSALTIEGGLSGTEISKDFIEDIEKNIDESLDNLSTDIEDMLSDNKITSIEKNTIEKSLLQLESESESIVSVAEDLGLKNSQYTSSLSELKDVLDEKILNREKYPDDITTETREEINNKFKAVEKAKSELLSDISEEREKRAKDASVGKGEVLNGVKIDAENGMVVTATDNKVRTIMNATEGIVIEKNKGSSSNPDWDKTFYVNSDGELTANELITRKLSIRDEDDNTIIDADNRTIDFSMFTNKIGLLDSNNIPKLSADKLNAGTIDAKEIEVKNLNASNIETGTLDANLITVKNLEVGKNVTMGSGASISWGSVSGKPRIPSKASDIGAKDSSYSAYDDIGTNRLTKINSNGIYTGTIEVGKLTGNLISGKQIRTKTSGKYVHMENQQITLYDGNMDKMSLGYKSATGTPTNEPYIVMGYGKNNDKDKVTLKKESNYFRIDYAAQSKDTSIRMNYSGSMAIETGGTLNLEAGYVESQSNIAAPKFNETSTVEAKENIKKYLGTASEVIDSIDVFNFNLKSELEKSNYRSEIGFVAEASPELREGKKISLRRGIAYTWKAIQEKNKEIVSLEKKVDDLEVVVSEILKEDK